MTGRTGRRRPPLRMMATMVAAATMFAAATPSFAQARPSTAVEAAIAERMDDDYAKFYESRGWEPLWLEPSGRIGPEAGILLRKLDTAQFDGLDPRAFRTDRLAKRLARAQRGGPKDRARAEEELSEALVAYVRATRRAYDPQIHYTSPLLPPAQPSARSALEAAAAAPSLADYLNEMRWLHPLYAPMRDAMQERGNYSESQRQAIWSTMARLRGIPPREEGRYVLVDAAGARLTMYEDGKPVDSMRVVVGKEANQTPRMAGLIQYAIVNPYWNIPPDLVQHNIATNVNDRGLSYLKQRGYEVLDGWGEDAAIVDPKTIDWKAVAAGGPAPRVRQKPGGDNFMGRVKFMFPNELGIYLHDTPDKGLLKADARQLSSGCVRLEDAERFGKWLMGEKLPAKVKEPETVLNMPQLVPVYITYLTARPEKGKIVFQDDIYNRDGTRLAAR